MAPTPEMTRPDAQGAMAHAATGNAATGMTTFYASVSLLGISVLFLLGYYSVKTLRGGRNSRPVHRDHSKMLPVDGRRSWSVAKAARAVLLGRRFGHLRPTEGTTVSGSCSGQSPLIPDEDPRDAETQAWAAAYLRHVRDMEDYAAGMPHIAHSPTPTPTPPPLYSTVCREASTGTIGIARSLDHKPRLPAAPLRRADSEADLADILFFYSDSDSDSDMDLDSDSSARSGTDSSFGSASSTLHTPDTSFCGAHYPGAVPAIVVDACEDVVPPPYEEDIADQVVAGAGLYLKVPSLQAVKVAAAPRAGAGGARRKSVKAEPRSGRGQSILARFAKEGFFRGARTRQLRVAN